MKTIYKYKVEPGRQVLSLPKDAIFLTVQTQYNTPVMWFEVKPDYNAEERRVFYAYATGEAMDSNLTQIYRGTFQLHGGNLVFHLYEIQT